MILRGGPQRFARFRAQHAGQPKRDLTRSGTRGMVVSSAAARCLCRADDEKTRYPSPSTRSAGFPCRPRFLADGGRALRNPVTVPDLGVYSWARGISTGADARCAPSQKPHPSQPFSPRHSRCRAVSRATLSAPGSALPQAGLPLQPSTGMSARASSSARLAGPSATKSGCATDPRAGRSRGLSQLIQSQGHRGTTPPVAFFVLYQNGAQAPQGRDTGSCSRSC